jgi:hypothetical protein
MNPPVTLLTLPSHLIEEIARLVQADIADLPDTILHPLKKALGDVAEYERTLTNTSATHHVDTSGVPIYTDEEAPPTIDIDVLEKLARWAINKNGQKQLKRKRLGMLALCVVAMYL